MGLRGVSRGNGRPVCLGSLQLPVGRADMGLMMDHSSTSHRLVLAFMGLALGMLFADASVASTADASKQGNYRGQCKRLTTQIEHYELTVLPMATSRGNQAWADATNAQVERLWNRRADLCPEYGAERTMMRKTADQIRKFNQLMALAGRAAVTYFTGGLGGFGGL